jgi:hypothetical protein
MFRTITEFEANMTTAQIIPSSQQRHCLWLSIFHYSWKQKRKTRFIFTYFRMYLKGRFLTSSEFHLYFTRLKASMATEYNQTYRADSHVTWFALSFRTLMAETERVSEASLYLSHLIRCLAREYFLYLLKKFGCFSQKQDSYLEYYIIHTVPILTFKRWMYLLTAIGLTPGGSST